MKIQNTNSSIKLQRLILYTFELVILTGVVLLSSIASCNNTPNSNQDPLEVLDKPVITEMIATVSLGDIRIPWSDFRKKYRNISIVYLQDGCAPCYPLPYSIG